MLLQPGNGRNGLEGRAGGLLGLGGIVVKRQGQILLKPVIVGCVHGSGQQVVVIAWVGHQGPDLPGVHIRDHHSAGAGVQGQLGRSNVDLGNPLLHEFIGILAASCQKLPDLLLIIL